MNSNRSPPFFEPKRRTALESEEVDAAEEIDAGPVIHRAPHGEPQVLVESVRA